MMKFQVIYVVVLLCSTSSFLASASMFEKDPLTVTLLYESLCPYCIQFIETQLLDVYKLFKDHIQLELVPYGNAKQNFVGGLWKFDCQHGVRECQYNKLHACAILDVCGDSGTVSCEGDKVSQVLKYISCVMKHEDQLQATAQCAKISNLDANNAIGCALGDKGDELLNYYGNRTEEFTMEGVPAVFINGEAVEENLMDRLCQLIPSVCRHTTTTSSSE